MKILLMLLISFNTYAFRCAGQIVDVGTIKEDFITYCGSPLYESYDALTYKLNGMTYTVYFHPHTNLATRIEEERK